MWRWLAAAVVLLGCRHKPPEPLIDEPEVAPRAQGKIPRFDQVAAARPEIDLSYLIADPTHSLRWPLTISDHPELVPQFDIAHALAEPGVDWIDLCRLGAHNRRAGNPKQDLLEYLRAWCSVAKRDADAAAARLVQLTSSTVLGLPAAARKDLVNILIDLGNADQAEHLISKHQLADVELLDRLAASYVEIGKLDDAFQINERALDTAKRTSDADRCRRMARRIVLGGKSNAMPDVFAVESKKSTDPTCVRIDHELQCWLKPEELCGPYFVDQKIDHSSGIQLLAAFHQWPRGPASSSKWMEIAGAAAAGLPLPGADRLAAVALDAAMRASDCRNSSMRKYIVETAERVLSDRSVAADLQPGLRKIRDTSCAQ